MTTPIKLQGWNVSHAQKMLGLLQDANAIAGNEEMIASALTLGMLNPKVSIGNMIERKVLPTSIQEHLDKKPVSGANEWLYEECKSIDPSFTLAGGERAGAGRPVGDCAKMYHNNPDQKAILDGIMSELDHIARINNNYYKLGSFGCWHPLVDAEASLTESKRALREEPATTLCVSKCRFYIDDIDRRMIQRYGRRNRGTRAYKVGERYAVIDWRGQLLDVEPSHFATAMPDFDAGEPTDEMPLFVEECLKGVWKLEDDTIDTLLHFIGMLMVWEVPMIGYEDVLVVLVPSGNGKSTLKDIIIDLLGGSCNVLDASLASQSEVQFAFGGVLDKWHMIIDEVQDASQPMLKKIVKATNGQIRDERKGMQAKVGEYKDAIMCFGTEAPQELNSSRNVARRIATISAPHLAINKEQDPRFAMRWRGDGELRKWFWACIGALQRASMRVDDGIGKPNRLQETSQMRSSGNDMLEVLDPEAFYIQCAVEVVEGEVLPLSELLEDYMREFGKGIELNLAASNNAKRTARRKLDKLLNRTGFANRGEHPTLSGREVGIYNAKLIPIEERVG